jgi:hypothetical protein
MIRSWGQDRILLFVVDDFLIGIPLIVTAILMRTPTPARWCAFAASFAVTAGMLYGSFFGNRSARRPPGGSSLGGGRGARREMLGRHVLCPSASHSVKLSI